MRENKLSLRIGSILALLVTLLVVSACMPGYNSNPSLALQDANATAAAANVYLQQTADARSYLAQQATIAAAQTQDVFNQQATQSSFAATQTQAVILGQATQTAQAVETKNSQATETASGAQTATAFPPTQEAMNATSTAMALAVIETERRAFWGQFITPLQVVLPALLLGTLGVLAILALMHTWPRLLNLLEALEMRARTIISPDGEIITFLPKQRQVDVIQPKRNFGAALSQGPGGVKVEGMAPDLQLQADTTARQQAAVLAHYLPNKRSAPNQRLLQSGQRPAVRVLQPGEPLPPHLLADSGTLEVLDAQWRDAHEQPS